MQPLAERLRPKTLDEYIGQKHLVGPGAILRKMIDAGRISSFILWGPPGVGKTTLAQIIANKLETPFYTLSAVTSGVKDVREVIDRAKSNRFFSQSSPILFIDEIHRLSPVVEEYLYSAMEDFALDIIIGKGPSARSIRLDLSKFTLIGATTRAGSLSAPLRDRFGVMSKFELYTEVELAEIIKRSARIIGVEADDESVAEMAKRSRGTPRVANRILKRIRDFSQVQGSGRITLDITNEGHEALEIDSMGLERLDREILTAVIERFNGGPVGIATIAASIGEERVTIEEAYEPYLLQIVFLSRTKKGRMVTPLAYKHLGLEPPEED